VNFDAEMKDTPSAAPAGTTRVTAVRPPDVYRGAAYIRKRYIFILSGSIVS
jgi:hypothetical protein